jgi:allantoinase
MWQGLARQKAHVNVGYWAGLVPENARHPDVLQGLLSAGALGFKAFMCPTGISEFEHVSIEDIRAALPTIKKAGVPLLVHAELVHDLPPVQVGWTLALPGA